MRKFQKVKEPTARNGVHPVVRWVWQQINLQKISQEEVAARAGVGASTMRKWRLGTSAPKFRDIEAVVNVLGGKLTITGGGHGN